MNSNKDLKRYYLLKVLLIIYFYGYGIIIMQMAGGTKLHYNWNFLAIICMAIFFLLNAVLGVYAFKKELKKALFTGTLYAFTLTFPFTYVLGVLDFALHDYFSIGNYYYYPALGNDVLFMILSGIVFILYLVLLIILDRKESKKTEI